MTTNRLLGAVTALVTAAVLSACSSAVAGTPAASGGGGDPGTTQGATLWTQYGATTVHNAVDVASLDTSVLWLDTDGKVWTGKPSERGVTPAAVTGLPDGIIDIDGAYSSDGITAAAVAKDGSVWMWGRVVGAGPSGTPIEEVTDKPVRIEGVQDARSVEVGRDVTFAVTSSGTVVSWGRSGDYTMLGRRVADNAVPQPPAPVPGPTDVVSVSAGFPAVLAMTGNGQVWGWGSNNYDTLAPNDDNPSDAPRMLPELHDIALARSTDWGAYAVTRSGAVLTWGDGSAGALGDDAVDKASIDRPHTLAGLNGSTVLAAGASGGLVADPDGAAHVWGKYAVPDGKGAVLPNDTAAPQKLSWITGKVVGASMPSNAQSAYAFLVR